MSINTHQLLRASFSPQKYRAEANYFVRCKEGSWLIFRTELDDLLGLSSYVLLYSKTRACSIYSAHLTYYDYFACLVRE